MKKLLEGALQLLFVAFVAVVFYLLFFAAIALESLSYPGEMPQDYFYPPPDVRRFK